MITRRQFTLVLGTAALAPLTSMAQQSRLLPVVGVLSLEIEDRTQSVRQGLQKLGYVDGQNIQLVTRAVGDRYAHLEEVATEFVRRKVDVIVSLGTTATHIAKKATATIPIVMVAGVDPVEEKFASSLSHPGGNITGIATILRDLSAKRLQLAKEAVPGLNRVGIMWNPDSRTSSRALQDMRSAAPSLNLQLEIVESRSADEFEAAFAKLARGRTNVFVLLSSSMFTANKKELLESAAKYKLAAVTSAPDDVRLGALITYGGIPSDSISRTAFYVDKILKGAKPGELAIEQPTTFELGINMKVAKALSIKIPQSILVQATKVIQ